MERIYYSPSTVSDLFRSIPESIKAVIQQEINWGKEKVFNPEYWPTSAGLRISDKGSTYLVGTRPGFTLDHRYGDRKIIVQGEQEILYFPQNRKEILVTLGDTSSFDITNRINTPRKVAEYLDELFLEENPETEANIERELFGINGVALQNTAWNRTMTGLVKTYERALEGRAQAASERASTKSWSSINPEEIYQAFYEVYLSQGIEEFLAWGKEKGIDEEVLRSEFMNLPQLTEQEIWNKFAIRNSLVSLRLSENHPSI